MLVNKNINLLQRITITGLLIALVVILQKIIAINYVPGLPFVRLSFGAPALIIYSSVFLGPFYGLLIGIASDILGFFMFDASGFGIMPQITAIYGLLGFFPYFAFKFVEKIKNKNLMFFIEGLGFLIFLLAVIIYFVSHDGIVSWVRIGFPVGVSVLSIALLVFIYFFDRKKPTSNGFNVIQISFASFASEVIVMLIFGTRMKGLAFPNVDYLMIFISQALVMFFNVALTTIVIYLLLKVTGKYLHK